MNFFWANSFHFWPKFSIFCFDPYWQISGAWATSIYGKLIQSSILEFWGMTQADFWNTHLNMDEFSRNRSSSCPDILQKLNRYSQKIDGWIFQKSVQLIPQKLKFRKNTEWVFQKSACVTPGKLKFRKNFWVSFPGFANKGYAA